MKYCLSVAINYFPVSVCFTLLKVWKVLKCLYGTKLLSWFTPSSHGWVVLRGISIHILYFFSLRREADSQSKTCLSLRSCAGPRAGDGCVVCHSPAWVKDIQINRQLSGIIQLFSGLESLFRPTEEPGDVKILAVLLKESQMHNLLESLRLIFLSPLPTPTSISCHIKRVLPPI